MNKILLKNKKDKESLKETSKDKERTKYFL